MLTLFHTNDLHGRLTEAMALQIAEWKAEEGMGGLYFDSGDCIKAGNLAIPLRSERAWGLLERAGCDAGTLGNRESHPLESAFQAKLKGVRHPLLVANLRRRNGERVLPASIVLEREGIRVGVVGTMVAMVTERMAAAKASAFLWDPPIPAACAEARRLRPDVDCLVGLTHIGFRQDQELAAAGPEFDLILGGHSHTVLESPVRIGETFVCQGGAFGKVVGVYRWEGRGRLAGAELRALSTG